MKFYSSIVDNYSYIFPFNPVQVDFVLGHSNNAPIQEVLEIGCATGSLTLELAKHYKKVYGIDLNEEMIAFAKEKMIQNMHYQALNMLDIGKVYSNHQMDQIICFGNTLVHLDTLEQITLFFSAVKKVLKKGGSFMVQIINYDRILDENISALDTIDNDKITFKRNYVYDKPKHKIHFNTQLLIKGNKELIENSIDLYPLRKSEIEEAMQMAGFSDLRFYGNFKSGELTEASVPLIAVAK